MSIYTQPETKAQRARALRYKRPALASMGYDDMLSELYDISDACADVRYLATGDIDTLTAALDGNEDEAYEFRMCFGDLDTQAEQLSDMLHEYVVRDEYDDCTVALVGRRYKTLGYDAEEEDYYSLTSYETGLAQSDAGKRIMRHTKTEMLSIIGQCTGALIAFLDLRQRYDYLKTTMDVLRDRNTTLLDTVRAIDSTYAAANAVGFDPYDNSTMRLDALLASLPEKFWVE